jgi:hypothetical protein
VVSLTRSGVAAAVASLMRPATQDRDDFFLHLCAIMSGLSSQAAASAMSVYILKPWPGAGEFMESAALQGRVPQPSQSLAKAGSDCEWMDVMSSRTRQQNERLNDARRHL